MRNTRRFVKVMIAGLLLSLLCVGGAVAEYKAKGEGIPSSAPETSLLFVQDAKGGTFTPTGKRKGEYWLTLHGAKPRTLWFQNRPGSLKGSVSNKQALKLIFGKGGEGLPNGSVDAWDPRRRDDIVMGIKFLSGTWLPGKGVLRYKVRRLQGVGPKSERGTIDKTLPPRFSTAAVFIDDIWTEIDKLFVDSNTCLGELVNATGQDLWWATDFKDPTDSWVQMPARYLPAYIPEPFVDAGRLRGSVRWGTSSGWLVGCYNRVTYVGDAGRVTVGLDDPYRGSNEWACTTFGDYVCEGPHNVGDIGGSVLYGKHMRIIFSVHMKKK